MTDRTIRVFGAGAPALVTPGRTPELRGLSLGERAMVGPVRLAQGPVLATSRQVVDAEGGIGAPLVALSTLALLERKGTITPRQRQAGETFHASFRMASLDELKAADMARLPNLGCGGTAAGSGNEAARRRIGMALGLLGGEGSVPASCAWHVLGLEWSLREWAAKALRGNTDRASGVLVASLAVLEPHFGA